MRILDVGCGNGLTLLEHHNKFRHGVGIDNDPEHFEIAETNKKERGVSNVEFMLFPAVDIPVHLGKDSFDFVFTERGPLGGTSITIQAALYVLKPGEGLTNKSPPQRNWWNGMKFGRRPATDADTEFARGVHHLAYRNVVERQFGEWDVVRQDQFFANDWAGEASRFSYAMVFRPGTRESAPAATTSR